MMKFKKESRNTTWYKFHFISFHFLNYFFSLQNYSFLSKILSFLIFFLFPQGLDAVDPFTREMIPPSSRQTEREFEVYWLLYTFTHWELRLSKKGNLLLRFYLSFLLVVWIIIVAFGAVMWYLYPFWYIIWGYIIILAAFVTIYDCGRLRAVSQLISKAVTHKEIDFFLNR